MFSIYNWTLDLYVFFPVHVLIFVCFSHFSVDTRDSNFAQGTHWSDETYRERLSFHVEGRAGTLTIKSTTEDDTGEYRCRVDFQKSPTRNSKVNLTVISKYWATRHISLSSRLFAHTVRGSIIEQLICATTYPWSGSGSGSWYCLGFHSLAPANHGTQLLDKHISYRIRRQLYVRVAKFSLLFSYRLPLWHSALGKQILKCQLGEKFKCGWLKLLKEKRKASECRVQFQNWIPCLLNGFQIEIGQGYAMAVWAFWADRKNIKSILLNRVFSSQKKIHFRLFSCIY